MNLSKTCLALIVPLSFSLIWACGSDDGGDNGGTGASAANGSGGSAGALSSGGALNMGGDDTSTIGGTTVGTGGTTVGTGGTLANELCGDAGCVCSNGLDDDEDGLVDGLDPECTGPFDNDEASFATGIPGDNRDPKWQDCFFDGNSGAGDDDCRYATECLTGEYDQDHEDCQLTDACVEFCGARTPNGCDCFGCCSVELTNGTSIDILTGTSCSLDKAEDADACPRCEKSTQCGNTCGTCELCPGKTIADLPAECAPTGAGGAGSGAGGSPGDGGPGYTCDGGEQVCGDGLPACPFNQYCSLGCCLQADPK